MILNQDCMRKILMFVEDNIIYSEDDSGTMQCNSFGLPTLYKSEELCDFTKEEIHYTVLQLFLDDYIKGYKIPKNTTTIMTSCDIDGLTMKGHKLLDNIRENTIWAETKNRVGKFGKASIDIVSDIASNVISELIKSQMNIK